MHTKLLPTQIDEATENEIFTLDDLPTDYLNFILTNFSEAKQTASNLLLQLKLLDVLISGHIATYISYFPNLTKQELLQTFDKLLILSKQPDQEALNDYLQKTIPVSHHDCLKSLINDVNRKITYRSEVYQAFQFAQNKLSFFQPAALSAPAPEVYRSSVRFER